MTEYKSAEKFIEHLVYVALQILNKNEGKMSLTTLRDELEAQEQHQFPEGMRENRRYWHHRLASTAHSFVEAGYLVKLGGEWQLTEEGAEALESLGKEDMIKNARDKNIAAQKARKSEFPAQQSDAESDSISVELGEDNRLDVEEFQSNAKEEIRAYIHKMNPYDFQRLCAALLRGMGYHTSYVAPPGIDGGVDVIAYADPLGVGGRIKAQIKRHNDNTTISVDAVRELAGVLQDGDIGVFITSSKFKRDCEKEARKNSKHIELIDFGRFVDLWFENYDKLSYADKQRLPLQHIHCLAKD